MSAVYTPRCVVRFSFTYGDRKNTSIDVYARSCTVSKKDYREASEFSIVVGYQYAPFDPRIIANGQVAIYMEDTKGNRDFTPSSTNLIMLGYVEDISADALTGDFTVTGTDYTTLFLQKKVDFTLPAIGQDVVSIFEQLRFSVPAAGSLKVAYRGKSEPPIVAQALGQVNKTSTLGMFLRNDSSVWDLMQEIANNIGHVCYMELDTVIIADPYFFTADQFDLAYVFGFPFNTENIVTRRRHGRYANLQVELLSVNGQTVSSAVFPEVPLGETQIEAIPVDESGKNFIVKQRPVDKVQHVVNGNVDTATLRRMAQSIYYQLKSQQNEVMISTRHMDVFTNKSKKTEDRFPIFNMRIGDNLVVVNFWDQYTSSTSLQLMGYDAETADGISNAQSLLSRMYYIDTITFNYSSTEGVSTAITGISRLDLVGAAEQNIH